MWRQSAGALSATRADCDETPQSGSDSRQGATNGRAFTQSGEKSPNSESAYPLEVNEPRHRTQPLARKSHAGQMPQP
jgi:hypothetical protein